MNKLFPLALTLLGAASVPNSFAALPAGTVLTAPRPLATAAEGTVVEYPAGSGTFYTLGGFNSGYTWVTAINSPAADLIVPDSLDVDGRRYEVQCVGDNGVALDLTACPNLRSLTLPATIERIYEGALPAWPELHLQSTNVPELHSNASMDNLTAIYVPAEALATYESRWPDANVWPKGWTPMRLTIDNTAPGELAQKILAHIDNDWTRVNELTVTGTMNSQDFQTLGRLTHLTAVDLSATDATSLPASTFNGKKRLTRVVLPESLTAIGDNAFYGCRHLTDIDLSHVQTIDYNAFANCYALKRVDLSEQLTSVGSYVFAYSGLESVSLPASLKAISSQTFYNCASLSRVELAEGLETIGYNAFEGTALAEIQCPASLRTIGSDAFSHCDNLTTVQLNEGLTTIDNDAFRSCPSLTAMTWPSTLTDCPAGAFYQSEAMRELTVKAVLPPNTGGTCPLESSDLTYATLRVPAVSVDAYRQASGWNQFLTILPLEGDIATMRVDRAFTVADAATLTGQPDITLVHNDSKSSNYAQLTVAGTATLAAGNFTQSHRLDYRPTDNGSVHTALVANAPMTAESVSVRMRFYTDRWHFISFPFDVRVADIQVPEGTYWVIRKYSGADRAAARMDATWQNMTADSTLHAKEGYILQLTSQNESRVELTFPAVDNSNKNRYFAADDVQVPLSKYVAEFSHNRSWNLVGNPYPAYYDSRLIEHSGPITVWDGDNYVAYSLEDDSYVLKPGEAFFVQRPDDEAAMVFAAEGRQLDETAVSRTLARRLAPAGRTVVNLTLTGDSLADRTRVVLNDEASPAYELERDASKFMSSNPDAPQLYSQADGVRYAINERPAADGRVSLGASFGHDGRYTLALASCSDARTGVTLVDRQTGSETDLTRGAYTFDALAGTADGRFELRLTSVPTAIDDAGAAASCRVSTAAGLLCIEAPQAVLVTVTAADGRQLYRARTAGARLDVPAGVYIVRAGSFTQKVSVTE